MTSCGPSATESCCVSTEVEGGTFFRTYTNDGGGPSGEADPASVSSFRLDKYVVTVGRFRQFIQAWNGGLGYAPLEGSGKHTHLNGGLGLANSGAPGTYEPGWNAEDNLQIAPTDENLACETPPPGVVSPTYTTWTASPGSHEALPITCANWWESYAFCIWDGGFLPSEAEWEYAAAGGSQQREYAWGSEDPGTASKYAIYNCDYPGPSGCTGVVNIAPVGTATLGAGLWGQLDMVGEEYEWTLDNYADYVDPCVDCANLTVGSGRVTRASAFWLSLPDMVPWRRNAAASSSRGSDDALGLRCARASAP